LEELYLGFNEISDEEAISIKDALSTNGSLTYLNLEHNSKITEQTMQYIASTMRKRNNM
jgi:hypothetical protein